MNSYYGTDAIVLASRERGESDMYLTLFTKDLGRISAIATGVRLAKSKLRGHLQLFTSLRLMLTRGSTVWRVIDAESYSSPRTDAIAYRKRCADFMVRMTGEEEPDLDLWDAVLEIAAVETFADEMRFKLRVLEVGGFLPDSTLRNKFFTPRGCAFIADRAHDALFADTEEREAFEEGIEGILRANHMLY